MIRPAAINTGPELNDYLRDLADDHEFRVSVSVLDGNEDELTSLTASASQIVDGSVTYDATQGKDGVSRQLSLVVVDEKGRLHCDPSSPAAGAIGPGQFIQVTRSDFAGRLGRWVDVPVFHGPLTAFERQGPEVTIEAMGKELYLLPPFGTPKSFVFHKGHPVVDVIHDLAAACGNRKFNLPRLPHRKLHTNITIHKWEPVWPHIVKLAGQINRFAFFDGRGFLTLRAKSSEGNRYAFTGGPGGVVDADSLPSVRFDFLNSDFANTVVGTGHDPAGQRKAPTVVTTLPNADPLSPESMAWNGESLHAVDKIDNDKWTKTDEIKRANESELRKVGKLDTSVSFESLPIPVFEEHDPVALSVTVDEIPINATFTMLQWTLPLAAGQAMSVGTERPRWRKARHKHRHHKHRHHGGKS